MVIKIPQVFFFFLNLWYKLLFPNTLVVRHLSFTLTVSAEMNNQPETSQCQKLCVMVTQERRVWVL